MDRDQLEPGDASQSIQPEGLAPTPATGGRFPYATWGLLPVLVFSVLLSALALGAIIVGGESEEDLPTDRVIVAQVITGLFLMTIPFTVAFISSHGFTASMRALGFRSFRVGKSVVWAATGIGSYLAFAILYSTLIGRPEQEEIVDRFGSLEFQILLIVILAPLAEEIAFRGFLFGGLRTKMPLIPAALTSGVIFGLLHSSTGLSAVPVLIFLGVVFAVLYEKTKSLWPPILLHAVNNGFALVVLTAS